MTMSTPEFSARDYCAAFLVDFLASVGATHAELSFNGSGDSGDVDDVTFDYRTKRAPTPKKIAAKWQLALARHHLLYPEYSLDCYCRTETGERLLHSVVEGFFYQYISDGLGDWVNNDGGGGTVTIDVEDRLINYSVSYNEVQDAESQTGHVENPALFDELLTAMRAMGIAAIEAEFDFDSEGVAWSEELGFLGADQNAVQLEAAQEAELTQTCRKLVQAHFPNDSRFEADGNFCALFNGLYETLVEETALEMREDSSEGYVISLSLTESEGRPVLQWSATFRYMGSDDGESEEIDAPIIGALPNARRKRAA